jgi:hypothetical protein
MQDNDVIYGLVWEQGIVIWVKNTERVNSSVFHLVCLNLTYKTSGSHGSMKMTVSWDAVLCHLTETD